MTAACWAEHPHGRLQDQHLQRLAAEREVVVVEAERRVQHRVVEPPAVLVDALEQGEHLLGVGPVGVDRDVPVQVPDAVGDAGEDQGEDRRCERLQREAPGRHRERALRAIRPAADRARRAGLVLGFTRAGRLAVLHVRAHRRLSGRCPPARPAPGRGGSGRSARRSGRAIMSWTADHHEQDPAQQRRPVADGVPLMLQDGHPREQRRADHAEAASRCRRRGGTAGRCRW